MLSSKICLHPYRAYLTRLSSETLGGELVDDICKRFLLRRIVHCQRAFRIRIHAYLLLEKEIFLLMTPGTPSGFVAFSEFLRSTYSNYFSTRFSRAELLTSVRPAIVLLGSPELVRDCQKYIERYVVLYRGYDHPGQYRFSSYCANAFSHRPNGIYRHPAFDNMLAQKKDALQNYRSFIAHEFGKAYEQLLGRKLGIGLQRAGDRDEFLFEKNRTLTDKHKSGTMNAIGVDA